jgi:hypothetical protein
MKAEFFSVGDDVSADSEIFDFVNLKTHWINFLDLLIEIRCVCRASIEMRPGIYTYVCAFTFVLCFANKKRCASLSPLLPLQPKLRGTALSESVRDFISLHCKVSLIQHCMWAWTLFDHATIGVTQRIQRLSWLKIVEIWEQSGYLSKATSSVYQVPHV